MEITDIEIIGKKSTSSIPDISNKSFIHSPGKEKAKTSKLSLGRIGESAGDISGPGIIDKT
jgi:hypothetical protein